MAGEGGIPGQVCCHQSVSAAAKVVVAQGSHSTVYSQHQAEGDVQHCVKVLHDMCRSWPFVTAATSPHNSQKLSQTRLTVRRAESKLCIDVSRLLEEQGDTTQA